MNVASQELCKELYELSGWSNPAPGVYEIEKAWRPTPLASGTNYRLINIGPNMPADIPAYQLGYLLRKLPGSPLVKRMYIDKNDAWKAEAAEHLQVGDTPEDAVCALAIELFKQGVL